MKSGYPARFSCSYNSLPQKARDKTVVIFAVGLERRSVSETDKPRTIYSTSGFVTPWPLSLNAEVGLESTSVVGIRLVLLIHTHTTPKHLLTIGRGSYCLVVAVSCKITDHCLKIKKVILLTDCYHCLLFSSIKQNEIGLRAILYEKMS